MCDYCGCRRHPAIDELSDEHEAVLDAVYRLRRHARADEGAAARRLIDVELAPLLAVHTDKEEQGVFLQLRAAWATDERLDDLVAEHHDIDALLVRARAGGPDWRQAVEEAASMLSEHILAEETDLFPYALYELRDAQWDAVEAIHAALRPEAGHARAPSGRDAAHA